MQGTLKVMDKTGHSVLTFDTDTGEGVQDAIKKFHEEVGIKGALAFDTTSGKSVQMSRTTYNPSEQTDVTVVPAFQGG